MKWYEYHNARNFLNLAGSSGMDFHYIVIKISNTLLSHPGPSFPLDTECTYGAFAESIFRYSFQNKATKFFLPAHNTRWNIHYHFLPGS
ncbi:hypothetical protein HI914_01191 [Erysiphe necator]|nr:hypothetical protein HI914_01191 [Erysiphe necator]